MIQTCTIPGHLVPDSYLHDPATEVVLSGDQLREGMIVLLEYPFFRANPDERHARYQRPVPHEERNEKARWCLIQRIEQIQDDVVTFSALYEDGSTAVRRYSVTMKWYVMVDSLPSS